MGKEYKVERFFDGIYMHYMPSINYDSNGNRSLIHLFCFGPIEAIEYGVTDNSKFYYNNTYCEGLGEEDFEPHFEFIDKDRIIKAICDEIESAKRHKDSEMILALESEKEKILFI